MPKISIQGACDLHIHTAPDIFPRFLDDVEHATVCRNAGLRAILYKCHADTTMTRAWHTMRQVEGIKVFGGITLNLQAGGLNPAAVDVALQLGAAQVWMPSYHSQAHYEETGMLGGYAHQSTDAPTYPVQGITILDEAGKMRQEVYYILELVKKHNKIIGTAHLSAYESLALIEAAREVGCQRVVLTHPFFAPPACSIRQVQEAVELGAFVEFAAGNAMSPIPKPIDLRQYVEIIKLVGADNMVISSDTGHPRKTNSPETMRTFAQHLNYLGVGESDLYKMLNYNYNYLLDLD